jgi:hypothetical protein
VTLDKPPAKPVSKHIPPDCLTAFRDEDFSIFAGQVIRNVIKQDKGSTVNQRRRLIISQIRDKVNDLGMSSNARRVVDKNAEMHN